MENIYNNDKNYEELIKEKDKIIDKLKKKIEKMKIVFKNILNEKKNLEEDIKENKIIIQTLLKNNKNANKQLNDYKKYIEDLSKQIEDLKEEKFYDRLVNLIIVSSDNFQIINNNNNNLKEENFNNNYINNLQSIKNNFDYDELSIDFIQFSIIEKKKNFYKQEQYNFDKNLAERLQKEEYNKNAQNIINNIINNDKKFLNKKEENNIEIKNINNPHKKNNGPIILGLNKEEREYMINNNLNFNINIDEMDYEQLLNLEEKIGKVSLGVDQEIIKKLGIKKYNEIEFKNCETCMICLDDFYIGEEIRQLDCLHIFHLKCIDHWLKDNKKCPVDFHEINFNCKIK